MIERNHRFGRLVFDRDAIVRAALRAYVEAIAAGLPNSLSFPVCDVPGWTGDLQRGAFYNGDGCGGYEVVAWTETGVVGLAYELGFGPIEQLGLSSTQLVGTLLDGAARHTPEGTAFSHDALDDVRGAVRERDAPFGDYGEGPRTA